MRHAPRILLASGAFAAILAPAPQAGTSGVLARQPRAAISATVLGTTAARAPAHLARLGDSGFGAGMWLPATDLPGFASAQLFDGAGHLRYTMRANLLASQSVPPGVDQQGGFLGVLSSVGADGTKSAVAQISGKWIRHPNGWGEFDVEVLIEGGNRLQPLVSVGSIQGSLMPPGVIPGPELEPSDGGEVDPTAPGELVLMWSIPKL